MAQALISQEKREKLFRQCKHMLGAPIRGVELLDEMMDNIFDVWAERRMDIYRESIAGETDE